MTQRSLCGDLADAEATSARARVGEEGRGERAETQQRRNVPDRPARAGPRASARPISATAPFGEEARSCSRTPPAIAPARGAIVRSPAASLSSLSRAALVACHVGSCEERAAPQPAPPAVDSCARGEHRASRAHDWQKAIWRRERCARDWCCTFGDRAARGALRDLRGGAASRRPRSHRRVSGDRAGLRHTGPMTCTVKIGRCERSCDLPSRPLAAPATSHIPPPPNTHTRSRVAKESCTQSAA